MVRWLGIIYSSTPAAAATAKSSAPLYSGAAVRTLILRAPRTMTILSLVRPSLWHAGNFRCDLTRVRLGFLRQAPHSWHFRWTAPLCGRHLLQRHKPAD